MSLEPIICIGRLAAEDQPRPKHPPGRTWRKCEEDQVATQNHFVFMQNITVCFAERAAISETHLTDVMATFKVEYLQWNISNWSKGRSLGSQPCVFSTSK